MISRYSVDSAPIGFYKFVRRSIKIAMNLEYGAIIFVTRKGPQKFITLEYKKYGAIPTNWDNKDRILVETITNKKGFDTIFSR